MDLIKMLDSIDFIDGRVDLNSIHPTNLLKLVEEGYIEKIDPGDGEACFYVLSPEQTLQFSIKELRNIANDLRFELWYKQRQKLN